MQCPADDLMDMLHDIGVPLDEPGQLMSAEEYLNPEDRFVESLTDVSYDLWPTYPVVKHQQNVDYDLWPTYYVVNTKQTLAVIYMTYILCRKTQTDVGYDLWPTHWVIKHKQT